ncbi:DUF2889 domain-containing protein [Jatrophihabitans sp. DSM 45814]
MSNPVPIEATAGDPVVLETLLDVLPSSNQAATVTGWARWQRGEVGPTEFVELSARVDEGGLLAELNLMSNQLDLAAFKTLEASSATSGFRRRMTQVHEGVAGSLLAHRLLDDVPILLRVSGQARLVEHPALPALAPLAPLTVRGTEVPGADQCEGWRADGTMVQRIINRGGNLTMALGEAVQPDAAHWSDQPALPAMATRRRRRVEVDRHADGHKHARTYFRDSYADPDGVERGLHSYHLQTDVTADGVIEDIDAIGVILPWPECWQAAGSATALAGVSLATVDNTARTTLVGLGTCTHLTDTLRTLGDIALLSRGNLEGSK